MIEVSAAGRPGTPHEVANVAALLMGPDGGFITGSDFLMDGGLTAAYRFGNLHLNERRASHCKRAAIHCLTSCCDPVILVPQRS